MINKGTGGGGEVGENKHSNNEVSYVVHLPLVRSCR